MKLKNMKEEGKKKKGGRISTNLVSPQRDKAEGRTPNYKMDTKLSNLTNLI